MRKIEHVHADAWGYLCIVSYLRCRACGTAGRRVAKQATAAGTFGVGGFLMDRSGHVLAEAINAVVDHGEIRDPTAHAERQLIDWFFQAQARGLAIAPNDAVIVSYLILVRCVPVRFFLQDSAV